MRNSPEEYGAYIGTPEDNERRLEKPHYTREQFRKIGRGAMNCHHLFWVGSNHRDWTRQEHDFLPQMYIPAHNALHAECPSVPELSREVLRIVRADFRPTGNTLDSLDEVICLIDHASTMEQVHPIDRQLAQMAIHALEMQKFYLRGNIAPYYDKKASDIEFARYMLDSVPEHKSIADRNYYDYVRGYK